MALAKNSLTASAEPTYTLDVALEGLASAGYRADAATWARFVDAGLLRRSTGPSPHLILIGVADLKRFRAILDLELRLGQPASLERLAFYLCATGMADVPATKVLDFIEAGVAAFFSASECELRALPNVPVQIGLDGERALAKRLAAKLLETCAQIGRNDRAALAFLAEIGCTLFLRATWRNRTSGRGPVPRIVTDVMLDPESLYISPMSAGRPLKSTAAERLLPPAMNIAHVIAELRQSLLFRAADIIAAASDSATVADRVCPGLAGPQAPTLLQTLVPLLAAAFARMRASGRPHMCERIAKSAWSEPEAMRQALLTHWS
ncbi:MAG TPA: hypothetical protein VII69_06545 [Candidatus Eremiobacteraceae bacterium]